MRPQVRQIPQYPKEIKRLILAEGVQRRAYSGGRTAVRPYAKPVGTAVLAAVRVSLKIQRFDRACHLCKHVFSHCNTAH